MHTPLHYVPTRKCRLALFPAVIVAALFLFQLGAAASPPLQETGHYDNTALPPGATAVCGFPVFGHFEGDFHFTVFYDQDGNIVREVDTFPSATITVYAPSTGKSYTSASPIGSTATAARTGLLEKIDDIDMDGGRVVFEARVTRYDAAGVPIIQFVRVISSSGPDLDAPIRFQRCAAMMP